MDSIPRRTKIVLSFWAIILIGLPCWWYTTRIYRAPLPLRTMLANDKGNLCPTSQNFITNTTKLNYEPEYRLLFTLAYDTDSHDGRILWDISEAIERHLQPALDTLSPIVTIYSQSHIQMIPALPMKILRYENDDNTSQRNYMNLHDIPQFANTIETSSLLTSMNPIPTVHMILYLPSKSMTPLYFISESNDSPSTSLLYSERGAIVISNEALPSDSHINGESLKDFMETVQRYLLEILGLEALSNESINEWLEKRAKSNLVDAGSTLASLARLVNVIKTLEIPFEVAELVDNSIALSKASCQLLENHDFASALKSASYARSLADQAFLHPQMQAGKYEGGDHRIGVYVPLFGPLVMPLLIALVRELQSLIRSKRKRTSLPSGATNVPKKLK